MDEIMIEIKKGVPVPGQGRSGRSKTHLRIAADAMEVGDMVEVQPKEYGRMRAALSVANKKATSRKLPNGMIGVWRIE